MRLQPAKQHVEHFEKNAVYETRSVPGLTHAHGCPATRSARGFFPLCRVIACVKRCKALLNSHRGMCGPGPPQPYSPRPRILPPVQLRPSSAYSCRPPTPQRNGARAQRPRGRMAALYPWLLAVAFGHERHYEQNPLQRSGEAQGPNDAASSRRPPPPLNLSPGPVSPARAPPPPKTRNFPPSHRGDTLWLATRWSSTSSTC